MGIFWLVFYIILWGIVHSMMASLQFKALLRRAFSLSVERVYRLIYNIFSVLTFLPVLAIVALTPDRILYSVPLPWSGLMVLGELLAITALVVGVMQTGAWDFIGVKQLTDPQPDRSPELVTRGLYRFIRHPLYSAGMVFIWLAPRMTVNLLALNSAVSIYLIIGALFEERKLQRQFGQAYVNYKAATPMFIPFIDGNKSTQDASN